MLLKKTQLMPSEPTPPQAFHNCCREKPQEAAVHLPCLVKEATYYFKRKHLKSKKRAPNPVTKCN